MNWYLFLTFGFVLAAISLHELGHAFVLLKYNVEIEEVCLLGFGPKILTWKMKRIFGETPVTIRLIPLGAFVRFDLKILRDKPIVMEHVCAAGIGTNLFCAMIIGTAYLTLTCLTVPASQIVMSNFVILACVALLSGILGASLLFWPRSVAFIVPFLGMLLATCLVWQLGGYFLSRAQSVAGDPGIGGPIEVYRQAVQAARSMSFSDCARFGFIIMLNLGLFQCMPIGALDGGHIVLSILRRSIPEFMQKHEARVLSAMVCLTVLLIIIVFSFDLGFK